MFIGDSPPTPRQIPKGTINLEVVDEEDTIQKQVAVTHPNGSNFMVWSPPTWFCLWSNSLLGQRPTAQNRCELVIPDSGERTQAPLQAVS